MQGVEVWHKHRTAKGNGRECCGLTASAGCVACRDCSKHTDERLRHEARADGAHAVSCCCVAVLLMCARFARWCLALRLCWGMLLPTRSCL